MSAYHCDSSSWNVLSFIHTFLILPFIKVTSNQVISVTNWTCDKFSSHSEPLFSHLTKEERIIY